LLEAPIIGFSSVNHEFLALGNLELLIFTVLKSQNDRVGRSYVPYLARNVFDGCDHFWCRCRDRLFFKLHPHFCVAYADGFSVDHEREAIRDVIKVFEFAVFHLDDHTVPVDVDNFSPVDFDLSGCCAVGLRLRTLYLCCGWQREGKAKSASTQQAAPDRCFNQVIRNDLARLAGGRRSLPCLLSAIRSTRTKFEDGVPHPSHQTE